MASETGTVVPAWRARQGARATIEFLTGLLVLVALVSLLALALLGSGRKSEAGYRLSARFTHIDGLSIGSDVRLAGVSVGQVVSERVDPTSYQAEVTFTVRDGIRLPTDSSAIITSDSLLGGKYLALDPGGADQTLKPGARLTITQGSISLEQLLSKFIFSVTDAMSAQKKGNAPAAAPAPAPAP
jgi:phospholipid/cholesterol/gamma-HCH transport system substrate-binding protein